MNKSIIRLTVSELNRSGLSERVEDELRDVN